MKKKKATKRYDLVIMPALEPAARHEIETALASLGYEVSGGRTMVDMSECDITFEKEQKENNATI